MGRLIGRRSGAVPLFRETAPKPVPIARATAIRWWWRPVPV